MAGNQFEADVIAELTALKLVVQQTVGLLAFTSGAEKANEHLRTLRQASIHALGIHKLQVPGHDVEAIKLRAEFTIDQIFDSVTIDVRKADDPPPAK